MRNNRDYFTKERITVFVFIVVCLISIDIISVLSGDIGSYDTEGYRKLISIGIVFIAVFRPKLFDDLLSTFLARFKRKVD